MRQHLLISLLLCWTVSGTLVRAIDGDTFEARLSVWHGIEVIERIRILGVNTPEKRLKTMKEWVGAYAFTDTWLKRGPFMVESCERDSLRRALGKVYRGKEVLSDELIKSGHGVPFFPK